MTIFVNGEPRAVAVGTTVAEVVQAMTDVERGVAVAVEREVVPRSAWTTTTLTDGDHVEVLVAAAGG